MAKSLVIVESPAKAQTIGKYLGREFTVKASVGHIKDLPKGELGVDLEHDFVPTYAVLPEKRKVVAELRKAASSAERVFLACDPDREGEAIAWHVAEEIAKGKRRKSSSIHRVLFNEITKQAVQEAIRNPVSLDKNLYEAQQARRVLDRLVGYQISPLLWEKVRRGLSAGRVQSVAVRLICEREREVKAFRPEEYWTLDFLLEGSVPPPFQARVTTYRGEKLAIKNRGEADRVVAGVGAPLLKTIVKKERRRYAPPPFITSRLQQDASQKMGFTAKRTMAIAQQLYEGVDLGGDERVGLITYMRTDSTRLAESAVREVREVIRRQYGTPFLPEKPNFFKNKKAAQDAHEAIRPTLMDHPPDAVRKHLTAEQFKLYELIWKRFLASQMTPAVFDQTTFEIESGDYGLRAVGSQMKFPGFLAAYQVDREIEKNEPGDEAKEVEGEVLLPDLKEGERLQIRGTRPEQHFTEPPPCYNEASLIKELEEKGIGRPSTYAAIVSTILEKEYVQKEGQKFTPTPLGVIVNDLLVDCFPDILNVEFTAQMEEELDEVEEGRRNYVEALRDFYLPFEKTVATAKVHMKDIKRQEIKTDLNCEKCGGPMVIKWGRRGEFLACTNYPECKNTREFHRDEEGEIRLAKREVTGEFCANCGAQMIIKTGRFGKFLACSSYPQCKSTRPISIGVNCPQCGKPLAERRSKKGRSFYGCTGYPKCRFASWDKPLLEACPQCASPILVVRVKKTASEVRCPNPGCSYSRPVEA